jgi:predicted  nucleic acid-binding Zn-ribbon protein
MKAVENKIYQLSSQIESLESQLKVEKERVIKETIKAHAEALYKEMQTVDIKEFTQRDIEQYFKDIVWDIKDILRG